MKTKKLFIFLLPVIAVAGLMLNACKNGGTKNAGAKTDSTNTGTNPAAANAGLTLPAGFSAAAIVENLSSPRHLAVTPQNDIYVHLSGSNNGKGILVFHDEAPVSLLRTVTCMPHQTVIFIATN
jgi:glucose/arabinose dehydrogenase